jgi:hypothetical protein
MYDSEFLFAFNVLFLPIADAYIVAMDNVREGGDLNECVNWLYECQHDVARGAAWNNVALYLRSGKTFPTGPLTESGGKYCVGGTVVPVPFESVVLPASYAISAKQGVIEVVINGVQYSRRYSGDIVRRFTTVPEHAIDAQREKELLNGFKTPQFLSLCSEMMSTELESHVTVSDVFGAICRSRSGERDELRTTRPMSGWSIVTEFLKGSDRWAKYEAKLLEYENKIADHFFEVLKDPHATAAMVSMPWKRTRQTGRNAFGPPLL